MYCTLAIVGISLFLYEPLSELLIQATGWFASEKHNKERFPSVWISVSLTVEIRSERAVLSDETVLQSENDVRDKRLARVC